VDSSLVVHPTLWWAGGVFERTGLHADVPVVLIRANDHWRWATCRRRTLEVCMTCLRDQHDWQASRKYRYSTLAPPWRSPRPLQGRPMARVSCDCWSFSRITVEFQRRSRSYFQNHSREWPVSECLGSWPGSQKMSRMSASVWS